MSQFLRDNWKLLAVLSLLLVGAGYTTSRFRRSLASEQAPAWAQLTHHRSAASPRNVLQQYQALLKSATAEAAKRQQPIGSIRFLELGADAMESVLWTSEWTENRGYQPLVNVERSCNIPLSSLLGFYTIDGQPLSFTTRVVPGSPRSRPVTLHLETPLAPGTGQLILRRERSPVTLQTAANGQFELALPGTGRRRGSGSLQVCGIYLGADTTLTRYTPQDDVLLSADSARVGWIDPAGPVVVNFTRQ